MNCKLLQLVILRCSSPKSSLCGTSVM